MIDLQKPPFYNLAIILLSLLAACWSTVAAAQPSFSVTLPKTLSKTPVTGRLLVVTDRRKQGSLPTRREPRTMIAPEGPPVFGIDVVDLQPDGTVVVDTRADGFPFELSKLPAGRYSVQAILIPYRFASRSDGHKIWVPTTDQRVPAFLFPGNFFSKPLEVEINASSTGPVQINLTETIAPIAREPDTAWLKRVRIRSKILSEFWGFPMYIGAEVLLPKGFQENPNVRYPAIYTFAHFGGSFNFTTDPATDNPAAKRAAADAGVEPAYQFSQKWRGENFPRMVGITLDTPGPYFFESYALNSANNGPWGDAITKELMPYLEKNFRLINQPYGRVVQGLSTGGWEALAMQLHYPDTFGGAWVTNPDPIDFTRYGLTDIYREENIFNFKVGDWRTQEKPFRRSREGHPIYDFRTLAALEAVLGSKGRSYFQLDVWQTTYGPVGTDGYPVLLFDKKTGVINKDVVRYMREKGYDLSGYARDNWAELGPKLRGKLNIIAGDMDDFHLNLAVYQFQDMIKEVAGEDYPIKFTYGRPKKGHNWHHTNWEGFIDEVSRHVKKNAPQGAPVQEWNY